MDTKQITMKTLTLEQAVKAVIEASEGSVPLNNAWVYSILSKALKEDSQSPANRSIEE